ncbi:MAG TPA: hypothetical protein VK554_00215 [Bradyrhizobium sp.]|nr:hypothetical protein [Bradyrhizobium sp.]
MTPAQQQWHWQEGNKYALECMKALLLLNGGGALALYRRSDYGAALSA